MKAKLDSLRPGMKTATLVLSWGAVGAVLALHVAFYWNRHADDDPYIFFRYAQNLLLGQGLAWNPGEQVQGYSSLLWVLLNAGMSLPSGDFLTGARILSAGALVAFLLVGSLWVRRINCRPAGGGAAVVYGLLVVCSYSLVLHAVNGWETSFFGALVMGGLYCYACEVRRGRGFPWSALLAILIVIGRSEGPAHLIPFLVFRLVAAPQESPGNPGVAARVSGACVLPPIPWRRRDSLWWGGIIAFVAGYGVFQVLCFGTLATGPLLSKVAGHSAHLLGREYVIGILFYPGFAQSVLLLAGIAGAIVACRDCLALLWLPCAIQLGVIWYADGDLWPSYRLFSGFYPLLWLGVVCGVTALAERIRQKSLRCAFMSASLLLAGIAAWGQWNTYSVGSPRLNTEGTLSSRWHRARELTSHKLDRQGVRFPDYQRGRDVVFHDALRLVLNTTGPDEAIVFPDIGFMGFATRNVLFDARGLTDFDAGLAAYCERTGEAAIANAAAERFVRKVEQASPPFVGIATTATLANRLLAEAPFIRRDYVEVGSNILHRYLVRRDRLTTPIAERARRDRWFDAMARLPAYPFFRDGYRNGRWLQLPPPPAAPVR